VHYAYVGNVHDKSADSTYCHGCGKLLIGRDWYELSEWNLDESGMLPFLWHTLCRCINPKPGNWGAKRKGVIMS